MHRYRIYTSILQKNPLNRVSVEHSEDGGYIRKFKHLKVDIEQKYVTIVFALPSTNRRNKRKESSNAGYYR